MTRLQKTANMNTVRLNNAVGEKKSILSTIHSHTHDCLADIGSALVGRSAATNCENKTHVHVRKVRGEKNRRGGKIAFSRSQVGL